MKKIVRFLRAWMKYRKITIQKITDNRLDVDILVAIGKLTFLETFQADNHPKDILDYVNNTMSRENIAKQVQNPNSYFYLATITINGKIDFAGYLKVNFSTAQTELQDANALEIERIYVVQEYQGRNIGQALLNKAIKIARKHRKQYVFLGVWERNTSAIAFYKKNKFVQFSTHTFQLGESKQTDWLMKRSI